MPPDINRLFKSSDTGPKFININRTDHKTFENVSPFLIKKVIDYTCNGLVESCKKTRIGGLLIKTKDTLQAIKLIKLSIFHDFPVSVSEHSTLNFSKGVIYSNDLRNIEEEIILQELKSQNVTEIRKIKKMDNNELKETGLIIITFASLTLPETMMIGYEKVNIRPYIPLPLRCRNCLRLGHPTTACKSNTLCNNCSAEKHTSNDETCANDKFCINCKYDLPTNKHSPIDKTCPAFIKQKELTSIKTLEKVDHKTAIKIYYTRHIHQPALYSTISAEQPTKNATTPTKPPSCFSNHQTAVKPSKNITPAQPQQRKATSYDDLEIPMDTTPALASTSKSTSTFSSSLSEELKLKIYTSKQNTLAKPLKSKEKNEQKPKKNNKITNHLLNSDSDSI